MRSPALRHAAHSDGAYIFTLSPFANTFSIKCRSRLKALTARKRDAAREAEKLQVLPEKRQSKRCLMNTENNGAICATPARSEAGHCPDRRERFIGRPILPDGGKPECLATNGKKLCYGEAFRRGALRACLDSEHNGRFRRSLSAQLNGDRKNERVFFYARRMQGNGADSAF